MDLRQLRYFATIADCRSINLAARKLNIAQPALTRQLQLLESFVGASLFQRSVRGVTLTDVGKQLLGDALQIIKDVDSAQVRAQKTAQGELGHLRIGLPVMRYIAPPIARMLRQQRLQSPNVSLAISHFLSEKHLELLLSGRLDAAVFLYRQKEDVTIKGFHVYTDRMVFICPRDWEWPRGLPARLSDLAGIEFIWIDRDGAPKWHDELMHCFSKAGFFPRPRITGPDVQSMLALVAAGLGCSIVPESAARLVRDDICFVHLRDLDFTQRWEIVWRVDNESMLLNRLIAIAASVAEDPIP